MAPLTTTLASLSLSLLLSPRSPPLTSAPHLSPRSPSQPTRRTPTWTPGSGAIDPNNVNNHAFFALFAILGVAIVLGSIWFFFWARNGGFRWRGRRDWEEYKSTVLRRKGPNGTTLSGATKTTRLGGGSVVAGGGDEEKGFRRGDQEEQYVGIGGKKGKAKVPRGNRNNEDQDMRAYRHEKPAKVGGLNREPDGLFGHDVAYTDHTYSDTFSDSVSQAGGAHVPINTPRAKKPAAKKADPVTPSPQKMMKKKKKGSLGQQHGFYAQTPQSNDSTSSHRPLRPNAQSPAGTSTPSRSRQQSPTKGHAGLRSSVPGSFYTEPLDFESRYTATNSDAGVTEDSRGTKAYFHPIPGLGTEPRGGGGGGGGGFRRGRGRRDSLSDSEGETNFS